MNETEIPTPRTDAFMAELCGASSNDWSWFAEKVEFFVSQLERENAAMRAEITEAKQVLHQVDLPDEPLVVQAKRYVDQHDWHVGINRGRARQIDNANRVNAVMREVIKETHALFNDFAKATHYDDSTATTIQLGWIVSKSKESLTKLKPYLP